MGNWCYAILGGDNEFEFLMDFAEKTGFEFPESPEDYDGSLQKYVLLNASKGPCRANLEALSEKALFEYLAQKDANDHILHVAASLYMAAGAKIPPRLVHESLFWAEEPTQPDDDESLEEFEDRVEPWLSTWVSQDKRKARLKTFANFLRVYDGTPLTEEAIDEIVGLDDKD